MHITLVHIHVKSIYLDAFIQATQLNQKSSVEEPGCQRFDFLRNPTDPERFILYEVYVDEDAAKAHKDTLHYVLWKETVQTMMAEPRQGIRYQCLNHDEPPAEEEE